MKETETLSSASWLALSVGIAGSYKMEEATVLVMV